MKSRLSIQERLKDLRVERGLKLEELAEQTGISKSALGSYEADDYKEINHGSLVKLADFYQVSLDYLFGRTENRAQVNTPLAELHLDDKAVELLKSDRINNRLLCENNPEAVADRSLRILEACQIGEEDFFCHVTHKTWDAILHDIRKAHENDIESAPAITPADELIREVQKAMQSPGDRVRQFTEIFCKAFQLKYKRLSEEERTTLVKMFRKSPLIKHSGISFRRRGK